MHLFGASPRQNMPVWWTIVRKLFLAAGVLLLLVGAWLVAMEFTTRSEFSTYAIPATIAVGAAVVAFVVAGAMAIPRQQVILTSLSARDPIALQIADFVSGT